MNPETGDQLAYRDATPTPTGLISPTPPPSTLSRIFIGKDGLRAGWSLLVFIGLFAPLRIAANVIGHKFYPSVPKSSSPASLTPGFLFVAESPLFFFTLLVTWIMSKIEQRPNSVYGFGGGRKLPHFLAGLAWGFICLSLLILTLVKAGLLVFDSRLLFGSNILSYGVIWLLGFLLVGMLEEYLTRGYVQYTLTRGLAGLYQWAFRTRDSTALGFWSAAVIFSILFGLGHNQNPGESPIGLLSAGLVALVFCLSLWRTGSLWWAIGFHASWDWAQSFLYGVADSGLMIQHHLFASHPVGKPIFSGGTTGPEGSIFIVAVLALVVLIILVTLPRARDGRAAKGFER